MRDLRLMVKGLIAGCHDEKNMVGDSEAAQPIQWSRDNHQQMVI